MQKILITGRNSYIGNSFAHYVTKTEDADDFQVDCISLRVDPWEETSWEDYDVILHVAGIAHVDTKGATQDVQKKYYAVNRDLTLQVARKAKRDGVKQFVFLSSMIVFGNTGEITEQTSPSPANFYGDSKLQAEEGLLAMVDQEFMVTIVRPPFVYGRDPVGNYPKGNYPVLAKFGKKTPIFPNIKNKRSMIYIENLCEFLRLLVWQGRGGIFHPQNEEVVSTTRLVQIIAQTQGHRLLLTGFINPVLKQLMKGSGWIQKVFGSFYYVPEMSKYPGMDYQIYSLESSIEETEGISCRDVRP